MGLNQTLLVVAEQPLRRPALLVEPREALLRNPGEGCRVGDSTARSTRRFGPSTTIPPFRDAGYGRAEVCAKGAWEARSHRCERGWGAGAGSRWGGSGRSGGCASYTPRG